MTRALLLVLDSFGIGASRDAELYGDQGADTLRHIHENFEGDFQLPNLCRYGLHQAALMSSGFRYLESSQPIVGQYGYAVEKSLGKDTPSGHWEMTGVPVEFVWGYFPPEFPSFPKALTDAFIEQTGVPGILGNCHASGTEIIKQYGEEHIQSGKPIVYTSADSVFQIAAHETAFGLEKLYEICEIARKLVDPYNVGRVIARPFVGEVGKFRRTANRRDYSTPPPAKTLLDHLRAHQREVIAIGKIADIFAHRGVSEVIKGDGNMDLFDKTVEAFRRAPDGSLVFSNFVDFDSKYGHRRDLQGYGSALMEFDARLPELEALMKPDDILILSADHGCDPSFPGSDHTREHIPVIVYGPNLQSRSLGRRETFADIGQSLAKHLGIPPLTHGVSFL